MRTYTEYVDGKPRRTVKARNKVEAIRKFDRISAREAARKGEFLEIENLSSAALKAHGGRRKVTLPQEWDFSF